MIQELYLKPDYQNHQPVNAGDPCCCLCVLEMEKGEEIYCFSSSQVGGFFGMIIVGKEKDEIHLKVA